MDDRRVGRALRQIRIHLGWRQADTAARAGVSQRTVSEIELGRLEHVGLDKVRRVAEVLDVRISIDAWWRSGRIDHLLDRVHAILVERTVRRLQAEGWIVRVEYTFNDYGERGSVDIIAWHPLERVLLFVEIKSRVDDVQELHSTFDRKVRIVPRLLKKEEGWEPREIGRVLVLAATKANRDVVERHRATFDSMWPERTTAVLHWIRHPGSGSGRESVAGMGTRGGFGGILFDRVPSGTGVGGRARRHGASGGG
ncbi:MAG: helix-turn-helix domain-containing protein [Chloroflexota bacterium]